MKKRLISLLLTVVMLLSLVVVPANAALVSGTGTLTITPNVTSVPGSDSAPIEVIYTIKVTPPAEGPVGEFHFNLKAPDGMTLSEVKLKPQAGNKGGDGYWVNMNDLWYNPTTEEGVFETFEYTPASKYFQAFGTSASRNMIAEADIMTIKATIAAGKVGDFTLTAENVGINKDGTDSYSVDIKTTPVTITKAPISDVSKITAKVTAPTVGAALDTSVDLDSATAYTGTVKWYVGETEATETTAQANTEYTAKITLTAKTSDGESFDSSLGGKTTAEGYKIKVADASKLELTKTFDPTGNLPAASVTAPTAKTDLKYTGSEQALLNYRGTATNGTMQYSLNGTDWTDTDPMGKDAGEYTVYYKAKGNSGYSDSDVANIKVTIGQKDISGVTIDAIENQSYTGSAITPDPVVTDGTATLTKDKDYTVSCTDKYVGTATLTITGKGNYTGTTTANFTIVAANQNPTFTTPVNLATGGQLDLTTLVSGAKGNVTFTIPPATTSAGLSGHMLTATGITGEVKVSVRIAAQNEGGDSAPEYNEFSRTDAITVNVVAKTPASVTTAPTAKTNLKYNGNDQALVNEGVADGGTMQYSLNGIDWTNTVPKGKNAGDYTVYYKVVGDSGHTDYTPASNTVSVSIAQKEVTVSDITVVNKAYDGGTNATVNASGATFDGKVDGDTLTITATGTFANADVDNGKTVNLTLGTLSGASAGNYKLAATGNQTTTTADITQATLTVTPVANQSKKFKEADPALTYNCSGNVSGQTPAFNGALSRAEGEDVGQYDITLGNLTLKDNGNFKASNYELKMVSSAVKFEIKKADAPAAPTGLKGYKDSALSTVTLPTGWSWVDGTLKMDTIGDQIFKANYAGDTNHEAGTDVDVTVKVVQKSSGGYYYAPTAAVVPDMPMLYRGCTGDAVKTLQDKLNALGYNSGNVDGIFGAKTYAAVTAFQKANSLGVDGIVGKLTWGKLYGVSPAMPVETTTVVGRPMVSYGSRGDAVRKLQELLNALGYDCGSVDGIFGSKTKAAVLAFQKANGLGADGIVGPLTWGKLV